MAKKIYIKGNVFYIEDTETGELIEDHAKNILVKRKNINDNKIIVTGSRVPRGISLDINDIQDEAGAPFADLATFISFVEENTGFSTASGGSDAVHMLLTQSGTLAPSITNTLRTVKGFDNSPTTSRVELGVYHLEYPASTFTNAFAYFPKSTYNNGDLEGDIRLRAEVINDTTIEIKTFDNTLTPIDDGLVDSLLILELY